MSGLRRKGKNVIWNVCVPEELAVKAELFLAGGASRPIYGLRSQIICSLLRKYIAEEEEKQQQAARTAELKSQPVGGLYPEPPNAA